MLKTRDIRVTEQLQNDLTMCYTCNSMRWQEVGTHDLNTYAYCQMTIPKYCKLCCTTPDYGSITVKLYINKNNYVSLKRQLRQARLSCKQTELLNKLEIDNDLTKTNDFTHAVHMYEALVIYTTLRSQRQLFDYDFNVKAFTSMIATLLIVITIIYYTRNIKYAILIIIPTMHLPFMYKKLCKYGLDHDFKLVNKEATSIEKRLPVKIRDINEKGVVEQIIQPTMTEEMPIGTTVKAKINLEAISPVSTKKVKSLPITSMVISQPYVYNTTSAINAMNAINERTTVKYQCQINTETYQTYKQCSEYIMNNWFTEENIQSAYKQLASKELKELLPKNWSDKRVNDIINGYDDMLAQAGYDMHRTNPVSLELKMEDLRKPNKPARLIWNDTPIRCFLQIFQLKIFETILFDYVDGHHVKYNDINKALSKISHKLAYKAANKKQYVIRNSDTISQRNVPKPWQFIEIDQSSFDMSEQLNHGEGVLIAENMILSRITDFLQNSYLQEVVRSSGKVILSERRNKTTAIFKTDEASIEVKLDRTCRKSGDRGTSSLNYLVEMLATFVATSDDPMSLLQKLTARRRDWKKLKPELAKQSHYIPRYQSTIYHNEMTDEYYDFYFEGDDGFIATTNSINTERSIAKYHDLGLDCKLFVRNDVRDRVEFVGHHFAIGSEYAKYTNKPGYLIPEGYIPNVMRNLNKCIAKSTDAKTDALVSSNLMKARSFARIAPSIANYFLYHADMITSMNNEQLTITLSKYSKPLKEWCKKRGLTLEQWTADKTIDVKQEREDIKTIIRDTQQRNLDNAKAGIIDMELKLLNISVPYTKEKIESISRHEINNMIHYFDHEVGDGTIDEIYSVLPSKVITALNNTPVDFTDSNLPPLSRSDDTSYDTVSLSSNKSIISTESALDAIFAVGASPHQ